ncbi:S-layer homology domain-containing protein [Microcoleus sp. bin38.metabat.b11b12b14.051]|uniref:S-layer homology domain-containing protein n=1 Tax=Microcoleus sp. bin38.metabat.b11b12b14.051 TaxID=2742709 RepID=UPI0025FB9E0D|nr:S-layer homology domain-containing protein [Microcoleus sp. bin38.metabat.b11b12b14.051]
MTQFIPTVSKRGIIKGFPDGTFRPDALVTRAEFAAMIRSVKKAKTRAAVGFADVPSNFWARGAIAEAYEMAWMSGYPGNVFRPSQQIPRVQVVVALNNGLGYEPTCNFQDVLSYYNDAGEIQSYAVKSVAAATEKQLVVSYPNPKSLKPNQSATRAEVAAFIYQTLVSTNQAKAINSPYIAKIDIGQSVAVKIPSGVTIPIEYAKGKILLAPNDKSPITLTVASDIAGSNGKVMIPEGSKISGELRSTAEGVQFVAQELSIINGSRVPLNATSQVITRKESVTKGVNVGNLIKNTALGAAAAAAIAGVTGDRAIATEEVLGGAGIGTLVGVFLGRDQVDLYAVNPDTDLDLLLNSDLVLGTANTGICRAR